MLAKNKYILGGLTATSMAIALGGSTVPAELPVPKGCYEITDDRIHAPYQTQASRTVASSSMRMLHTLNIACAEPSPSRKVEVVETSDAVTFSVGRFATYATFSGTPRNTPLWHEASLTVSRNPDGSLNDGGITGFRVYLGPSGASEDNEHVPIEMDGTTMSLEISGERDPDQNYCNWDITTKEQSPGNFRVANIRTQVDSSPQETTELAAYARHLGGVADTIMRGSMS